MHFEHKSHKVYHWKHLSRSNFSRVTKESMTDSLCWVADIPFSVDLSMELCKASWDLGTLKRCNIPCVLSSYAHVDSALRIKSQTFWSWIQHPIKLAMCSHNPSCTWVSCCDQIWTCCNWHPTAASPGATLWRWPLQMWLVSELYSLLWNGIIYTR